MRRPLEERIRVLCAKIAAGGDELELPVIAELKSALHEHTERLRKLAAVKLASAKQRLTEGKRPGSATRD